MTTLPLILCIMLYWWIALGNLRQGDYGHALMWFAYGLANFGLLYYDLTKGDSNA